MLRRKSIKGSSAFFRVEWRGDGYFDTTHLSLNRPHRIEDADIRRGSYAVVAREPSYQIDFAPLLGKKVVCDLSHGKVHGTVTEIRYRDFVTGDLVCQFPVEVLIDNDPMPIAQIQSITLIER